MPLDVDLLAQHIRFVDGEHKLGAGALAESLLPFIESELGNDSAPSDSAAVTALLSAARAVVKADDAQALTSQLINVLRSAIRAVDVTRAANPGER
jgi:hypothetical protein